MLITVGMLLEFKEWRGRGAQNIEICRE